MTKITWINPAETDQVGGKTPFKITEEASTDQYGNHCRMWVAENKQGAYTDRIRVHSGSNGISICVKGVNNGHVHLTEDLARAIAKELLASIKYSKSWGRRFRDYWRRRNNNEI